MERAERRQGKPPGGAARRTCLHTGVGKGGRFGGRWSMEAEEVARLGGNPPTHTHTGGFDWTMAKDRPWASGWHNSPMVVLCVAMGKPKGG